MLSDRATFGVHVQFGTASVGRRPLKASEVVTRRLASGLLMESDRREHEPSMSYSNFGTILVVDDSPVICEVARHVLRPCGYEVLLTRDPFAALQTCRQHPGPIDLLVTDLLMPEMDGRDLATSVVQTRPTTRVLFMSGVVPGKDLPPSYSFLAKPYGPLDLLHKVEELLARDAW